ncbi:hypothetical protein LguiA_024300 [Lonicera macranthoides]
MAGADLHTDYRIMKTQKVDGPSDGSKNLFNDLVLHSEDTMFLQTNMQVGFVCNHQIYRELITLLNRHCYIHSYIISFMDSAPTPATALLNRIVSNITNND